MQLIITQFRSTTKKLNLNYGSGMCKKLNFANILVSNAKKIEFKLNLLFYDSFICSMITRKL